MVTAEDTECGGWLLKVSEVDRYGSMEGCSPVGDQVEVRKLAHAYATRGIQVGPLWMGAPLYMATLKRWPVRLVMLTVAVDIEPGIVTTRNFLHRSRVGWLAMVAGNLILSSTPRHMSACWCVI